MQIPSSLRRGACQQPFSPLASNAMQAIGKGSTGGKASDFMVDLMAAPVNRITQAFCHQRGSEMGECSVTVGVSGN